MVPVGRDVPKAKRIHKKGGTLTQIRFIGVDGEGVNRPDGKHEYVLLSVGNESLYYPDGRRLTFYDIVPFLWEQFLENLKCAAPNEKIAYVGFYLGYDFANWLKDIPENRARLLLTNEGIALRKRTKSGRNSLPFPIEHRGWVFDFLGLRRLRLWECQNHSYESTHKCNPAGRMYICDTGAFFQTSFLNVVEPSAKKWPNGAILSSDEYAELVAGKSERGFTLPYGEKLPADLISYNVKENEILARLCAKYDEGLKLVGINLAVDSWYGPGQAAQAWLRNEQAPTREEFEDATPSEIRAGLRASYYGGWFEIFAHGHIPGKSWSYDINSAYPYIQSQLPCIRHGKWTRGNGIYPTGKYVLCYGTATGSDKYIGCLPHRIRAGNILRPRRTKGWYWLHEIDAGKRAGMVDEFKCESWIKYDVTCDCSPPFRNLRTLYRDRLRVGKNSVGGRARRLIYNSTYGKTAQSIGQPKFANPFYASLITSFCRTYILNAIATHPKGTNDVLMVATDGITFRSRHHNLQISPETLGEWDEKEHDNLTLFMPGIYWDDIVREKQLSGESPSLKSRGIPARALLARRAEIDRTFDIPLSGGNIEWPTFEIPITFSIISPKQALARNKWELCANVTTDSTRQINADPWTKRNCAFVEIEDGIIRSYVYDLPDDMIETTPYRKAFGDEEQKELEMMLTQDGEIFEQLIHALRED